MTSPNNQEDSFGILQAERPKLASLAALFRSTSEQLDRQLEKVDAAIERVKDDGPVAWQRQQSDGKWRECEEDEIAEFERLGFKTRALFLSVAVKQSELRDAERLDFIESIAKKSATGTSFDSDYSGQYRMMWKHTLNPFAPSLRQAIDIAMQARGE